MAGKGVLAAKVQGRTTAPQATVTNKENSVFDVSFVPTEVVPHLVLVTFNGETVPGSPFTSQVCSLDTLSMDWDQSKAVPVGQPVHGLLHTNGTPEAAVEANVTGKFD